jgi:hypothetical protein
MSQGFDAAKPAFLDPLTSEPMRVNMTALATNHAGPQAPANPQDGWLWMDTADPLNIKIKAFINSAWLTILNNIQAGAPSQSNVDKFVHTQATGATQWTIVHTLNTEDITWTIYDSNGFWMLPNNFEITGPNTITVTFLSQESGKCVITG